MLIDPTELRERLEKALVVLEDDRRRTAFPATAKRLGGKIEGIKLALGYLDDAERMTPLDPESLAETALALLGVEATPENMAKVLNIRVIALAPDVAAALSTEPIMLVDEGYALARNATPVDLDALARQACKPVSSSDLVRSLDRGLAQSAAEETADLGDFTQYVDGGTSAATQED